MIAWRQRREAAPVRNICVIDRRLRWSFLLLCAAATCGALIALSATAKEATIKTYAQLPVIRPDFPVPRGDPYLFFYVQRSLNANTVVYKANVDAQGNWNLSRPVIVKWRRFATNGRLKRLSFVERWAFGVRYHRDPTVPRSFRVIFRALPLRPSKLVEGADGRPALILKLGPYMVKLLYAYVQLKTRELVPLIDYVIIVGQDIKSGKFVVERVRGARSGKPSRQRPHRKND